MKDPVRAVYEAGRELSLALAALEAGEGGASVRVAAAHEALAAATERLGSDEGQAEATEHWMRVGLDKARSKLPSE